MPVVGFPSGSVVARQNLRFGLPALFIKLFLGGLEIHCLFYYNLHLKFLFDLQFEKFGIFVPIPGFE